MGDLRGKFNRSVASLFVTAGLFTMAVLTPTSSYGGLLGTVAGGTLNVTGGGSTNYFDLSAIPGSAPVPQVVVDPGVEYTGNQPALQADIPGLTTHISADLADHQILLTWINSGFGAVAIPDHLFTFDLFPTGGQNIAGISEIFGLPYFSLTFGPHVVHIGYSGFLLGGGSSAFALYDLSFVSVPEPGTYLLLSSMALIALFAARRRTESESLTS